jgi:hypothetical protein
MKFLALAGMVTAVIGVAGCSSDPPPTMDTVHKLVAENRTFDALTTLIPMAQAGDPAAQYELAGFYHYGYVGAADFSKAMKWYRASARQGYADAMVGMAVLYLGGQGVKQDRREAFVWLNLAAEYMTDKLGVRKIKAIRDEIGSTLNPGDITYAKVESMMLQPTSSSVQPNEAESIGHLPAELPPTAPAPVAEPLQNVPPDTAPLPQVPVVPGAASTTTLPITTLPVTTPAIPAPAGTLPATTTPATPPISAKPAIPFTPATSSTGTIKAVEDPAPVAPPPAPPQVNPVPGF